MYAIMTVLYISQLQALSDLMVHILSCNGHQEHELECKERIYYMTLVCTEWLMYF